jgi:hypothetical protein
MSDSILDPELIVGVKALTDFFNARGRRVTYSMLSKLTMPSAGKGPPIEGYFGNLPVFKPQKASAWYDSHITPRREVLFRKRPPKNVASTYRRRGRPREQQLTPQPAYNEGSRR